MAESILGNRDFASGYIPHGSCRRVTPCSQYSRYSNIPDMPPLSLPSWEPLQVTDSKNGHTQGWHNKSKAENYPNSEGHLDQQEATGA